MYGVRSTISHELAHAWQWATNGERCVKALDNQVLYDLLEEEAEALATAWGYPPQFKAAKVKLEAREKAMRRRLRGGGRP